MIEVMTWLEVNKKRLVIGAVVLVAVGFGAYVVGHLADQKEANASAALLKLRAPVNAGTNQVAIPSSDYLKVAAEHAGTAAEQRAVILAAGALFTEGKFADAQAQFERVQKDFTGSPWAADAAYGVAASLEAQGKRDEAVTAYQRVTAAYAAEPVANDAHLALARIYEAKGQPDLALKQYDELAKPGAGGMTMKTQEALMMRERLIKKFPSLAPVKTNAPAMSAASQVISSLSSATVITNLSAATNSPAPAEPK
jgi:tetratricopeptide (TPR) repeat protein